MAKAAARHKDDDDDKPVAKERALATTAEEAPKDPLRPYPAGFVLGPLPEEQDTGGDVAVIEPFASSDVAAGFTPGTVPGSDKLSKINVDTPTYGTETPPRQTPPTSSDIALEHSPPTGHDANGAKIVSAAPTCASISPTTGTALSATPLTVTLTGTNYDRATYVTVNGVVQSQSQYVSATSMTCVLDLRSMPAGTYNITAANSAGVGVNRTLTLS